MSPAFDLIQALNTLQRDEVLAWVQDQLRQNVSPHQIFEQLSEGLRVLGDRFSTGDYFIPELMMGGEIFREALELAQPAIEASGQGLKKSGTLLIGTVQSDLHDLGKNLVSITFTPAGFEVVDLGKDVATERFIAEAKRVQSDILGLSALLTTTMEKQQEVIEALKKAQIRNRIKIVVGGAPVNQRWADQIGAVAYGADAIVGLRKAQKMLTRAQ